MNIISLRKRIVGTDVVSDVTNTRQSVIPRVVVRFLSHTATSYDKREYKRLKTDIINPDLLFPY